MNKNTLAIYASLAALAVMGGLMFASIKNDSIIIDEDPHIGAGYSYLEKGDYRINPEHPPMMKDIGASPLLWMGLNAPWNNKSWTTDINGQWEFGRALIFGNGNDADAITQAAKKPMIVFTLLLGLALWLWTKSQFGPITALLVTLLYAFSPTFIAHGRFVTTDVGASAGFFIATIAYLRFLKKPSALNIVLAGFALGFAFLAKFSTFMLVLDFFVLTLIWIFAQKTPSMAKIEPPDHVHMPFTPQPDHDPSEEHQGHDVPKYSFSFWPMMLKFVAVVIVAYIAIYPIYWHHTRNYPPERQKNDTQFILSSYSIGILNKIGGIMDSKGILPQYSTYVKEFPKNIVIWAADKKLLKPYSEYFLGLLMVFQRSAGGNTTFFLGNVTNSGSVWYFPIVYALKEPLAMHALTLIALIFFFTTIKRPPCRREWIKNHIVEISFIVVMAVYWGASMKSILNIGVRHVLPTFIFIYILAILGIVRLYGYISKWRRAQIALTAATAALLVWQIVSVVSVYPSFLAYFNEAAGGPDGGYKYAVDSNLDWGQDLKRLGQFVDQNGIKEISVDYFGWADPAYYLHDKIRPLSSSDGPRKGWVAVSASFYQGSMQDPAHDYHNWLPIDKAVAKIGHSIFVWNVQ